MPSERGLSLVEAFSLPGYSVPDALPETLTNDSQMAVTEYKIPLIVWMFFFLIAGYVGLRMILED